MSIEPLVRRAILTAVLPLFIAGCLVERCEWNPVTEATPGATTEDADASPGQEQN